MKGIIFDMDGLMFDTERLMIDAFNYAGERLGIGKAGFMAVRTLGMDVESSRREWERQYGEVFDYEKTVTATFEYLDSFFAENRVPVKKGLYVLLTYLEQEGYKMAIASSSKSNLVMHHLEDANVKKYFDVIVSGEAVKESKPSPEIYLRACQLLNLEPSECYALEDSKAGLLSAYHAGCKVIMVPDLWSADVEIQNILYAICGDLEEVKEVIERENFKVS